MNGSLHQGGLARAQGDAGDHSCDDEEHQSHGIETQGDVLMDDQRDDGDGRYRQTDTGNGGAE